MVSMSWGAVNWGPHLPSHSSSSFTWKIWRKFSGLVLPTGVVFSALLRQPLCGLVGGYPALALSNCRNLVVCMGFIITCCYAHMQTFSRCQCQGLHRRGKSGSIKRTETSDAFKSELESSRALLHMKDC